MLPEDVADPIIAAIQADHVGEMTITIRPQLHRIHRKTGAINSHDKLYSLFGCTEAMKL